MSQKPNIHTLRTIIDHLEAARHIAEHTAKQINELRPWAYDDQADLLAFAGQLHDALVAVDRLFTTFDQRDRR